MVPEKITVSGHHLVRGQQHPGSGCSVREGLNVHWLKHVADGLTLSRLVISLGIVVVGLGQRAQGFAVAASLLLVAWTTDLLDGPLARRSGAQGQTWLGAHDKHADIALGAAVLAFLCLTGLVHWAMAAAYVLVWAAVFRWQRGMPKSLGALFQGPIYGWFVYQTIQRTQQMGWTLVLWVVATVGLTWRRFNSRVFPGFLRGLDNHLLRILRGKR